ncbi:unnamed protein product [Cladocopium goreaui]|uniref:Protein N-lysine methyltransferase METTL21A (Methyltransferase-like protein 21A) n=1 Tax=Cladocopium goreaui TaxID=2562237 RepID=A0A9P1CJS6_9DINO|nr:unnamed protein product [Cladocopium goreaui]
MVELYPSWLAPAPFLLQKPGRLSCWKRRAAFSFCCSLLGQQSPVRNETCWGLTGLSPELCCSLAPWNDNERFLPYYQEEVLPLILRSGLKLSIYQEPADFLSSKQGMVRSFGSGYLWSGGYQMLRWLECSADLRPGSWLGRRFLDLGAGVGAVGLMALLQGAQVTLVDADAQRGLITRNLRANLPKQLLKFARICQLNWTSQSISRTLELLRACEGRDLEYDFLLMSSSFYSPDDLTSLMIAISKPTTRILGAFGPENEYHPLLQAAFSAAFETRSIRLDLDLTAINAPLLELRRATSATSARVRRALRRAACNASGENWHPVMGWLVVF